MTQPITERVLDQLQKESFRYFLQEDNPNNGLIPELIWRLMRECRWIKTGLKRAGFEHGWLHTSQRRGQDSPSLTMNDGESR